MRRSVLAWLVLLTFPAWACLQRYGEDPSDTWQRVNTLPLQQYRQALLTPAHDLAYWSTAKSRYGAQLSPEDPYTRTNYAVALLHLGEVEEALALLQDIEQETPGLYATAANLGTALELAGDNSVALHWIQEGINRNPESHQGSEWVHVKILQAKLALEKNPECLKPTPC